MGMEHHKISEYIDNLSFRKRVGGVDQEQVFEAIRELSSMYNEILAEVYEENERLKEELETSKKVNELRKRELENEEQEETDPSALPAIDKDLLKEILHTLSEAVTNLDLDQLEQSVQELSNYALEETHAALFKKLKTAVEELDFEACDSVLLDWITLL